MSRFGWEIRVEVSHSRRLGCCYCDLKFQLEDLEKSYCEPNSNDSMPTKNVANKTHLQSDSHEYTVVNTVNFLVQSYHKRYSLASTT